MTLVADSMSVLRSALRSCAAGAQRLGGRAARGTPPMHDPRPRAHNTGVFGLLAGVTNDRRD